MKKKAFILYTDNYEQIKLLTDEQAGILIKALFRFADTGEEAAPDDPVVKMVYSFMAAQIRRDQEKYENTCKRRSENAKKRWSKQMHASTGDKDSDSVSDSVKEKKKDTVSDSVCDNKKEKRKETEKPHCTNTAHTTHTIQTQEEISVDKLLETARRLGYVWSREEAERFLVYNKDRKRSGNWEYAVQRWEQQRPRFAERNNKQTIGMTQEDIDKMNAYLSVANRFREDM